MITSRRERIAFASPVGAREDCVQPQKDRPETRNFTRDFTLTSPLHTTPHGQSRVRLTNRLGSEFIQYP